MLEYQERGILDPISEDPANVPLEITGGMVPDGVNGHAIGLREWNFPRPEMASTFIPTIASEGDKRSGAPRFANRTIPVEVYIAESQGVDAATNLVTNPSFEKDTAGWATTGGALTAGGTLTRVLADLPCAGEYAANLAAGAANHGLGISATLAGSTAYRLRFRARKVSGSVASLTGAAASTGIGSVTLSTEWQSFELSFTSAGAGATVMSLRANASGVFQVDGIQLALASTPYYFDGDTPGCKWTGTPHASTSTRKGLGRKRFQQALYDLEAKIEKLARSGGTLKRYLHDGTPIVFDVIEATYTGDWSPTMAQGQNTFKFELTCKPAARLPQITYPLRTKAAAKSVLSAVEGPVPGNYPALGRLEITDTGTANRNFLLTALSSGRLDTSAPAEIEFLAKNLTPMSGAALANSPSTAGTTNGGYSNGVVSATLADGWAPYLSGKTLGGVYPTHRGAFRVWARIWLPTGNTGDVQLRLEYAGADLTRWTTNDTLTIPADTQEGAWNLIDLGMVRLDPPQNAPWGSSGAWRWEPRIAAKSTVPGDTVFFDTLEVFPADEFYAESRPNPLPQSVGGGLVARGFGAAAGSNLSGRTAELGGNWSGSGPTDFTIGDYFFGQKTARRTPVSSDSSTWGGRFARLGTGTPSGVKVEANLIYNAYAQSVGVSFLDNQYVITRYTDTNNFAFAGLQWTSSAGIPTLVLRIGKRKAGTTNILGSLSIPVAYYALVGLSFLVLADGSASATFQNKTLNTLADTDLATGGTLASGGYGIYHQCTSTGALNVANFVSFSARSIVTSDAPPDLVLASGRKTFIASDRSLRQSADGSAVGEIGKYEGDRLLVPCGGPEGKPVRWSVMDSRVDPDNAADSSLDTLTGQLSVIPRVTDVPEPQ